jgi:bromodomain containing 3b
MQPGMTPFMQPKITPSMQPGMTPLMQSIEGISHEQLNLCNATLITTYFQQIKDAMELNGIYKLFAKPIDPIIDNCIDYHKVIKRPMDMDTIYKNMTTGYYNTVGDMIDDINTCLTNYKTYHPANDPYISSIDKILALPFLARKLRQVGS